MYKKLSIFTLVTVAVIIAAAIFASMRAPQSAKEKPLFFPELKQRIEDVSHIQIKSFDDTINLARMNNTWGIEEFDGYPALPDKVKSTVLGTADLKLNAPKTALERLYPRLGVEGPIADESTSKLLTLKDATEQTIVEVIVGKPRRSSAAQSTPGLYVRIPDEEQSYLVDGVLELSAKKTDWIERSLLDIPADAIKRVQVEHPDGDSYVLFKQQKGQENFEVENLPEGKKAAPEIILNRYAAILADVQISSARKQGTFSDIQDRINTTIHTFDGLQISMQAFKADGRPYASFEFMLADTANGEEEAEIDQAELQQYVSNMNSKLNDWVFEIQGFKYDIVTNKSDKLYRDASK